MARGTLELIGVGWLAFIALGQIQVLLYLAKLAIRARAIGAADVSTSIQIGWVCLAGLTWTTYGFGYMELIAEQRTVNMLHGPYLVGRLLITLAVLASWFPGYRLCNRAPHYWPVLITAYSAWCSFWVAYAWGF